MRSRVPRWASALLALVCLLLVTTAAWAVGGFTIHKVDQDNGPIPGVKFEVYGKPTLKVSEPSTVDVVITKKWVDASDKDGMRPTADEFTAALHLLADGQEVMGTTPEVSIEGDSWTVAFKGLPKESDDGAEIAYTVSEDPIEGYAAKGSPAKSGETITNTLTKKIRFRKCWSFYSAADASKRILPEDYAPYIELWSTTSSDYDPEFVYRLPLDAFTRMDEQPIPEIKDMGKGQVTWYTFDRDKGVDSKRSISGHYVYGITYPEVPKYSPEGDELHYALHEKHITITGLQLLEIFNPDDMYIVSPTTKQSFMDKGFDEATAALYESLGFTLDRPLTKEEWLARGRSESRAQELAGLEGWLEDRVFWLPEPMYVYGVGEDCSLVNYYASLLDGQGGLIQ